MCEMVDGSGGRDSETSRTTHNVIRRFFCYLEARLEEVGGRAHDVVNAVHPPVAPHGLAEPAHGDAARLVGVGEVVPDLLLERPTVVRVVEDQVLAVDQRAGHGREKLVHEYESLGRHGLPQPEIPFPFPRIRRHHNGRPPHAVKILLPCLSPRAPVYLPYHYPLDVHLLQPARRVRTGALEGSWVGPEGGEHGHVPPGAVVPGQQRVGVPQRAEVLVLDGEGERKEVAGVGPVAERQVDAALGWGWVRSGVSIEVQIIGPCQHAHTWWWHNAPAMTTSARLAVFLMKLRLKKAR